MTPFETFFDGKFKFLLDHVNSAADPGLLSNGFNISEASWDRKAAYLLWVSMGRPDFGQGGKVVTGPAPDFTGERCADCNEPQFNTPSGVTCKNGHGGAPAAADDPFAMLTEEPDDAFNIL